MITGIKPDIAVICETHLNNDETVHINNDFIAIPHNRLTRHLRSKRNYGGINVVVNKCFLNDYVYDIVDKECDGILAIKFSNKNTDYCFLVIGLYLPPEQSPWGRDATAFFSHVLKLIYEFNYCDNIFLAGDMNSKLGTAQDFVPSVDDICERKVLDKSKNKHGQEMLDFLIESKFCVCNGRVTPEYDDYTFIHTRGKSVIDYICVPIDCLTQCCEFKVQTARDMVNLYCDIEDVDIDLSKMIPDHSILTLKFDTRAYRPSVLPPRDESDNGHRGICNEYDQNHVYFQRFNVNSIPEDFLSSQESRDKLISLIDNIEHVRELQNEIDEVYLRFCTLYHNEMNSFLQSKNVHPLAYKRFKRSTKPFWNETLSYLWDILCEKEKAFLLCENNRRGQFRYEFYNAQKHFDKEYRRAERNFRKGKIIDIENVSTADPNKFWDNIKKLGPIKRQDIPMEVYDEHGSIVTGTNNVLHKWKVDFENLYNFRPQPGQFDDDFYNECMRDLEQGDHGDYFNELDDKIVYEEVKKVIDHARKHKSVGIDNLPNEIFKNRESEQLLTTLFDKIYTCHLTPTVWNLAIIKPIPKNSSADPRLPLEYRGISLLSTVYKLFTSVLNNRIVRLAERHHIYADEQNGFRKDRSCVDHLFSLTSIIRNRKRDKLPTYVAFVDFEKAFDRVDRNLLYFKLKSMGVGGKMLNMIKCIYSNCESCINVNGYLTDNFPTEFGVRQGDTLSPTLFGLFINDLVQDMDLYGKGVNLCQNLKVSCLLYADDLAILAESEEDLQGMLNVLQTWCQKWRMRVNVRKTKVVHFRTVSQDRTPYKFSFNDDLVECVDKYKYLGIILDEHLDFNTTASVLAGSANRALGSIYTKFNKLKGLGFNTFSTLYHSGVAPILDYCSGVWGYQNHGQINTVQNRAIRFYLGVHKFAPNLAITGDVGWISSGVRHKIEMFRLWNRLINMDVDRLTKKIFMYDYEKRRTAGSWCSDILKIFRSLDNVEQYTSLMTVNLVYVKDKLHEIEKQQWETDVLHVPKLRTYCTFKHSYEVEPYVYKVYNRSHRSILAQFRSGILPLKIETGRYIQIPVELRQCILCLDNAIEDENHFFFECKYYESSRNVYLSKIRDVCQHFDTLDTSEKLEYVMSDDVVKLTAEYLHEIYCKRRKFIYN